MESIAHYLSVIIKERLWPASSQYSNTFCSRKYCDVGSTAGYKEELHFNHFYCRMWLTFSKVWLASGGVSLLRLYRGMSRSPRGLSLTKRAAARSHTRSQRRLGSCCTVLEETRAKAWNKLCATTSHTAHSSLWDGSPSDAYVCPETAQSLADSSPAIVGRFSVFGWRSREARWGAWSPSSVDSCGA